MAVDFQYDYEGEYDVVDAETGQPIGIGVVLDDAPGMDVGSRELEAAVESAHAQVTLYGTLPRDAAVAHVLWLLGPKSGVTEADVIAMIRALGGPVAMNLLGERIDWDKRPPRPDVGAAGRERLASLAAAFVEVPVTSVASDAKHPPAASSPPVTTGCGYAKLIVPADPTMLSR